MKYFLALFFLIFSNSVFSETQPAQYSSGEVPATSWYTQNGDQSTLSGFDACQKTLIAMGYTGGVTGISGSYCYTNLNIYKEPENFAFSWVAPVCPSGSTRVFDNATCSGMSYRCPKDQNWTLAGTTCTRPDCLANQTRSLTTGLCGCDAGVSGSTGVFSFELATLPNGDWANLMPGDTPCVSGCSTHLEGTEVGEGVRDGVSVVYVSGAYVTTGVACMIPIPEKVSISGGSSTIPNDTCPAGQIFMQNAFGYVCAVPAGSALTSKINLDPASSVPQISTTTGTATTVTNADGSTTTTSSSVTVSPNSSSSSGSTDLVFPTDLAKTGEAASAAKSITDLLNQSVDVPSIFSTNETSASMSLPVVNLLPSVESMRLDESSIPWWSWSPPLSQSTCTPFVMNFKYLHWSMDFCPKIAILQSILGWFLAIITLWEMQSLVFRKV